MSFKDIVEQAAQSAGIKASPEQCACTRTELRERTIRGGSKQFVKQCMDCGEAVGNPAKQFGNVPPFDEELRKTCIERAAEIREEARQAERALWWANYDEYMAGEAWAALRRKVLARDGNVCRGCLTAKATEVHHMSYENFGAEFAFELQSLCHGCHVRYHKDDE